MTLTVGSLFAGIGGFDLGLEMVGMRTVWQSEIDPFARSVLRRHWPDATMYGDVTEIDWAAVQPVDVVCGGFPCQPASVAGKQRGVTDDRWLWPEFARCVRALRPRFVLVENVSGLLTVNDGRAFGELLSDLATLGYDAEWRVLSARGVGAPHLRERLWIIAHTADPNPLLVREQPQPVSGGETASVADGAAERWTASYADEDGRHREGAFPRCGKRKGKPGVDAERDPDRDCCRIRRTTATTFWCGERPEPAIRRVDDGILRRMDRARIAALGNAIVPQVAAVVGRRVLEIDGAERREVTR